MHNSYFLFKALAKELRPRLRGGVISRCFSQQKDELVLQIETAGKPFFVRALLWPAFSCLSFPESFHRAGKNTIDLFEPAIGRRIDDVVTVENDRSFYLLFASGHQLLFKMHGNRSNILWIENGRVKDLFKKQLTTDLDLSVDKLRKDIAYTREAFFQNLPNPARYFVTFDKAIWQYLQAKGFEEKSNNEKWLLFSEVLDRLNNPGFGIAGSKQGVRFTLLDETTTQTFASAVQALTVFHGKWLAEYTFNRTRLEAESHLKSELTATLRRLEQAKSTLHELQQQDAYRKYANLLMANLHRVPPGSTEIVISDFETGEPVAIRLKPELSPQKNAEVYYRKSRNRLIEIQKLEERIAGLSSRHGQLARLLQELSQISQPEALRLFSARLKQHVSGTRPARLPYHEILFNGFTIRIGRTAKDNDELTLKHAHKNDLWLHARDVPGSHVIVRHLPGKPFPKEVIERAAQLAAWYSKRKTESLCPVMVSEKKYVRKRKGDAPGLVIADRSRTILAEPKP